MNLKNIERESKKKHELNKNVFINNMYNIPFLGKHSMVIIRARIL